MSWGGYYFDGPAGTIFWIPDASVPTFIVDPGPVIPGLSFIDLTDPIGAGGAGGPSGPTGPSGSNLLSNSSGELSPITGSSTTAFDTEETAVDNATYVAGSITVTGW
jgi:hypothetical protein